MKPVLVLLAILLLCSVPATAVVVEITESETLVVSPELFKTQIVPGTLEAQVAPEHGTLTSAWAIDQFLFEPGPFLGADSMEFTAQSADSPDPVVLPLTVVVVPSALPVLGVFARDEEPSVALYHPRDLYFQLCGAWPSTDGVLTCDSHSVDGAKPGWLPVYGDWDGDGWHLPSLFDRQRGELHFLDWGPGGEGLRLAGSVRNPSMRWSWPTAGDWRDVGVDSLLLIHGSGTIQEFRNVLGKVEVLSWPRSLVLPTDGSFPWPIPWLLKGVTSDAGQIVDRQTVASVHSAARRAHWVALETASGSSAGWTTDVRLAERAVPIAGSVASDGEVLAIHFLVIRPTRHGTVYEINATGLQIPHPQTLPMSFPSEPPGG